MTTVLGTSAGLTGIWWQAHTKSILEKIVEPCNEAEESWMCGMGYLSGIVTLFNAR